MLNGKATIILLTVGLTKNTVKLSEYFPKVKYLGANLKVELHLSSNATKGYLKKCKRYWYIRFC